LNRFFAILFLLVLGLSKMTAQSYLSGIVFDANNQKPLSGVYIQTIPSKQVTNTDSAGHFIIRISPTDSLLMVRFFGYETQTVRVNSKSSTPLRIILSRKIILLQEYTITDKPVQVFATDDFYITNIEISPPWFIAIGFHKKNKKSSFFVFDSSFVLKKECSIPGTPVEFYSDAFNQKHIICEENVLQVNITNTQDSLQIGFTVSSTETFHYILEPLVAQNENFFFFAQYSNSRMQVLYFAMDKNTKTKKPISFVSDTMRQTMLESEGLRMLQLERIMASGMGSRGIETAISNTANYNTMVLYKNPVQASLFRIGDSIFVFDLYSMRAEIFNDSGRFIRSYSLEDSLDIRHPKGIFADEEHTSIYLSYEKDGFYIIRKLNLASGSIGPFISVPYQYPKHFRASEGFLYFTYVPKDSLRKPFIYRIRG
jgi:CarboxypepD_reg-like domain